MVRKEDEATFWVDVNKWVQSVGTSRMLPKSMPAWLAKFNPNFNPE